MHGQNLSILTSSVASSEMDLSLLFIANNVSHKFEEIHNDAHVNVSFLNPETTNWASYVLIDCSDYEIIQRFQQFLWEGENQSRPTRNQKALDSSVSFY